MMGNTQDSYYVIHPVITVELVTLKAVAVRSNVIELSIGLRPGIEEGVNNQLEPLPFSWFEKKTIQVDEL
jgi:hypothetical protein